ncbi:hypothetical protein GCM10010978_28160 [Compostibacillus humi]|uniref:Cytochrome c domain-containing protein n=1 Tax=Compostibacillus humi TaxID=1245525 RepID=A0A8J2TT29_9BACI|nr:c-type cytochrome [Compostibacillus humi]GFZ86591.1 hypothetical protein GCM10010978_28160 [Compostibacillus humi]
MKVNSIIFIVGFLIAFTVGYFVFDTESAESTVEDPNTVQEESSAGDKSANNTEDSEESATETTNANTEETDTAEGGESVPAEAEALQANNCLSCHAVESLGIAGGTTGPDLSQAYNEVEGKHGKDLDSFLQEPTSAVMSTVIGDNPLSDEERASIIEALKFAAEN